MLWPVDKDIESWVRKWTPFIKKLAFHLNLHDTDEDDWLQTARLVYWEVADRFDPNKGKSFDSFVLDMLKLRLLDLKKAESNMNRFWLRNSVAIDDLDVWCPIPEYRILDLDVSKDSETVLRLIYAGYSIPDLRRQLGIPISVINRAKDEMAKHFIEGGNTMMRAWLEERARELGIIAEVDENDFSLANRILSHGKTARRKFRIVPVPQKEENEGNEDGEYTENSLKIPEKTGPICLGIGCENAVIEGSRFCSLTCAERSFKELRKDRKKSQSVERSATNAAYSGEISSEAIKALENPFPGGSSAHEIFELFREGGTKDTLAEILDSALMKKGIKCISPTERVRRVVTDTRRLGFELRKSKVGFFKLTGRKRQEIEHESTRRTQEEARGY